MYTYMTFIHMVHTIHKMAKITVVRAYNTTYDHPTRHVRLLNTLDDCTFIHTYNIYLLYIHVHVFGTS